MSNIDFSTILTVIPTYNEKDNIVSLARDIFRFHPKVSILVVDDNSPDGTSQGVEELRKHFPRLMLHQRLECRSFGTSYIEGFQRILPDDNYQIIVMMDADFSHDHKEVPAMAEKLSEVDVVIGSRYVKEGGIKNWNWRRRLLSRFANSYARLILATPTKDLTSGFVCFRKDVLKKIDLDSLDSQGYAFLIEMKYKMQRAGLDICEHPITFTERRKGTSKMSWENIWEAIWLPWRLKLQALKAHWLTFILAAIFGSMIVSPYLYCERALGPAWQGINPQMADDSHFYLARIRDVMDGHPTLNNAYLAEYKTGWPQQLFLAEYVLAQPLKLFGLTVAQGQLIYNFTLPILAWLLTYLAFYVSSSSRFWSLVGTAFLLGGLFLFAFFRPVSPQFNFLFWLIQFILAWLVVTKSAWPLVVPLSILNIGLLFYIYPYYWTFYFIFFGLLFCFFWRGDRKLSWQFLKISSGGLAIGSFCLYYSYLASRLPGFEETLTRVSMISTRFPSGIRVVTLAMAFLILILAAWRWRVVGLDARIRFFAAGALACVISVNQHLLTGVNFEFSSHYYPLAVFVSVFGLVYVFCKVQGRLGKLVQWLSLFVMLFQVGSTCDRYFKTAFAFERSGQDQEYASAMDWLNQNTEADSVVYANETLSQLIPVYTANNVFYSRYANLSLLTDAEVHARFILNNYFEKFDKQFVLANDRAIFGVRHIDRYGHAVQGNKLRKLLGLEPEPEVYLPEGAMNEFLKKAQAIQSSQLASQLSRYRVDYVVWDKQRNPQWRFNEYEFMKPVFNDARFAIYVVSF